MRSSKRSLSQNFYQLIPSRFPPIEVYARLGDTDVQDIAKALEDRTNPRLREKARLAALTPHGGSVASQYQNWNHAPFAYKDPRGTFFLGPELGALELAATPEAALAFALVRREEFLGNTGESATGLDMRVLSRNVTNSFDDLTKINLDIPQAERWKIGHDLYDNGSQGIVFCRPGYGTAEFLAVFDRSILPTAVQGKHYRFTWDGEQIKSIYDFSNGEQITRSALFESFQSRTAAE